MLGIITPKVQENITAVGKVTLQVWSSNWVQKQRPRPAEALNSGTVDARAERKWAPLTPSPVLVSGEIFEDIGSNLCDLVHFGVKNKHFKQKHSRSPITN